MVLRQNLCQIMANVVKKVKKQAISSGFFRVFLGDYILKQETVVLKPPGSGNLRQLELEMQHFKGVWTTFLLDLGQKWQKTDNIQ